MNDGRKKSENKQQEGRREIQGRATREVMHGKNRRPLMQGQPLFHVRNTLEPFASVGSGTRLITSR